MIIRKINILVITGNSFFLSRSACADDEVCQLDPPDTTECGAHRGDALCAYTRGGHVLSHKRGRHAGNIQVPCLSRHHLLSGGWNFGVAARCGFINPFTAGIKTLFESRGPKVPLVVRVH